ncbi:MAG: condensation domain-containing protein [Jatrophihabitantaceae bacterium]
MTAQLCLPLSRQQRLWCEPGSSGAFHPRFIMSRALRITGSIDTAALRTALDDVVARHEILRTIIVRDGQPPYQQVYPPSPVPLTVRDLPPTPHLSRQRIAEEQLAEAEASSIDLQQLPLLRARLTRFDHRDSVLTLVTHHSACDGWSMNLLVRDLVACYAARTGERPLSLPDAPQYQDYARWQLANPAQPAAMRYWREQLDGARIFTLPTDHPIPSVYTAPYIQHFFTIDSEVTAALTRFVKAERCSGFMVMLAAFSVLAHRISGSLDPAISTMFHGRGEPQFKDTVGLFLNFLMMRTNLGSCRSFRDVVLATRATCVHAYEHQAPSQQVLETVPAVTEPLAHPFNSYLVFGYWDASLTATGEPFQLAEGAHIIRRRSRVSEHLPGGVTWNSGMSPAGVLGGGVQFNTAVFEERTVAGWISDYCRILATAMTDPNREWQTL